MTDPFSAVYAELRRLAARRLAREPAGQTLQPTALVHEAFVRLVGPGGDPGWTGRGHFFAAAAEAMRRILVDAARRKAAARHGGGRARDPIDPDRLAAPEPDADLLAVDAALDKLDAADPRAAALVRLRYFAGLTLPEAAAALGTSERSAGRLWAYARAWLRREVEGGGERP